MKRSASRLHGFLFVASLVVPWAGPAGAAESSAAGATWTTPKRWTAEGDRPMRVATYRIPAAAGDAEAGECGIFFFGGGQGGDVETNIERWTGQFEGGPKPVRSKRTVAGLEVTELQASGTYLSGGPMVAVKTRKDNFRLLGAIVAAPEGSLFFKLTGPAATVKAAQAEFEGMIASLKRH
jgi:hypothetical protein